MLFDAVVFFTGAFFAVVVFFAAVLVGAFLAAGAALALVVFAAFAFAGALVAAALGAADFVAVGEEAFFGCASFTVPEGPVGDSKVSRWLDGNNSRKLRELRGR